MRLSYKTKQQQWQFPKEQGGTEWNQRWATTFLLLNLAGEGWNSLGVPRPICPQPVASTEEGPSVYSLGQKTFREEVIEIG